MRNGWLFYGALGGPVFWALRLVIAYPLVPVACAQDSLLLPGLVSVVALVGAVSSAVVSVWMLRRAQAHSRARFMAKSGLVMAVLFALVILAESVPMLFGDPCLDVDFEPRRTRWLQVEREVP